MDEPRDPEFRREPLLPSARRLGSLRVEPVGWEEMRTALGRAAVEEAGEVGYDGLTVDGILARGGTSRTVFYRAFANAEDCYIFGYKETAAQLADGLLERCRVASDWGTGVTDALETLGSAIVAAPLMANGLILQVRAAGPAGMAARDSAFAGLEAALDRGREESPSGLTPPPIAAAFVLGAIEVAAVQALARRNPRDFGERIPDLAFLAIATYLGANRASEAE